MRKFATLAATAALSVGLTWPAVAEPSESQPPAPDSWQASSNSGADTATSANLPDAVQPASGAAASPSAAALAVSAEQFEQQTLELINASRKAAGLSAVTASTAMSKVARNWSLTMFTSGNFNHNPNYSKQIPQTNLVGAGENIQFGTASHFWYDPTTMHSNFMSSAGHRAIILTANFTHVGIGVYQTVAPCQAPNANLQCNYVYLTEDFGAYPRGGPNDPPSWVNGPLAPFGQVLLSPDWTGDGLGELVTVDAAGRIWTYPFTTAATLANP
ncbi:MAG: CAP domain-containing protein, partial [Bifidobacteriaceae bacterium]|nr:CAP domain-containing protein [Bifidobacteriaceae bacterium]